MGLCSGTVANAAVIFGLEKLGHTHTHTQRDSEGELVREYVGEHHTHRPSSLCGSQQLYIITTLSSARRACSHKLFQMRTELLSLTIN